MTINHEPVRKAKSNFTAASPSEARRLGEGFPGPGGIEEIAFQIDDLGAFDEVGIDIRGGQLDAGAEIGAHRSLAIGCDID